jgi:hypothetical protein
MGSTVINVRCNNNYNIALYFVYHIHCLILVSWTVNNWSINHTIARLSIAISTVPRWLEYYMFMVRMSSNIHIQHHLSRITLLPSTLTYYINNCNIVTSKQMPCQLFQFKINRWIQYAISYYDTFSCEKFSFWFDFKYSNLLTHTGFSGRFNMPTIFTFSAFWGITTRRAYFTVSLYRACYQYKNIMMIYAWLLFIVLHYTQQQYYILWTKV